jgi:GNAT superfamily N-acetyltransferase
MDASLQLDLNKLKVCIIKDVDYKQYRDFSCGNSSMDNFLKESAYYLTITKKAATSLVWLNDEIVGYFTLQTHQFKTDIPISELNDSKHLYIERIATREDLQGRGIGTFILNYILELSSEINERLIFLDALIEKVEWYEHRHFENIINEEKIKSNPDGLVFMYLDSYDDSLIDSYFGL